MGWNGSDLRFEIVEMRGLGKMIFDIDKYSTNAAIITDAEEQLTYAELASRVAKRASELERGVLRFCLCKNDIASVVEYRG